jgi:CubicO group peptidase (beta-lactamase class C family)
MLCAKAVDDAVGLVMREQHVAGLSIAAYSHGRLTCMRGYGFARIGTRTPATPATVYRIGSLTKSFTAAAVLRLAAQSKLELTRPIGDYVSVPWQTPVTLEELLAQTSGIPDYTEAPSLSRYAPYPPQQLIDAVASRPLLFPPGSAYAYSNTNYVLLGIAIERVSSLPFSAFLESEVLAPAGLRSTRYGDAQNEARGYARDALNLPVRPTSAEYGFSAAGMSSNAGDMLRWLSLVAPPYYGFSRGLIYGYDVYYARGYVNGYSSFALFDDAHRDALVILTNADALDLTPLAMDVFATLEPPKPGTRAPQAF